MALPRKLKNFHLFNDGDSQLGLIATVKLPKIAIKTEDYRGNFLGDVGIDMGLEAITMGWTPGGHMSQAYRQFGVLALDGVQLRFLGAYQSDDTGQVSKVEIVVRGRHTEIDPGDAKPGDDTEEAIETRATYYKLTVDGEVLIEIDFINHVYLVGGEDRYQQIRTALEL
jgi:uncharacterized protein